MTCCFLGSGAGVPESDIYISHRVSGIRNTAGVTCVRKDATAARARYLLRADLMQTKLCEDQGRCEELHLAYHRVELVT